MSSNARYFNTPIAQNPIKTPPFGFHNSVNDNTDDWVYSSYQADYENEPYSESIPRVAPSPQEPEFKPSFKFGSNTQESEFKNNFQFGSNIQEPEFKNNFQFESKTELPSWSLFNNNLFSQPSVKTDSQKNSANIFTENQTNTVSTSTNDYDWVSTAVEDMPKKLDDNVNEEQSFDYYEDKVKMRKSIDGTKYLDVGDVFTYITLGGILSNRDLNVLRTRVQVKIYGKHFPQDKLVSVYSTFNNLFSNDSNVIDIVPYNWSHYFTIVEICLNYAKNNSHLIAYE